MPTHTSRPSMSPVRRFAHILKWAAIWICAAILIAQYWRKEEELRFAAFHHPLDYLTGLLDFSRTLEPDGSSDGRMNLEAERADGATPPTWQEIKNPGYSQGMRSEERRGGKEGRSRG